MRTLIALVVSLPFVLSTPVHAAGEGEYKALKKQFAKFTHHAGAKRKWSRHGVIKARKLSKGAKALVGRAVALMRKHPRAGYIPLLHYKLGVLYYEHNHYGPSLRLFREVIKQSPKRKEAQYAAHFILDTHNIRKQWKTLHREVGVFLGNKSLGDKAFKRTLRSLYAQSHLKICETLNKARAWKKAARCYRAAGKKHPKSRRISDIANYNGALMYHRLKRRDLCIDLLRRIGPKARPALYKRAQAVIASGCQ